MPIDVDLLKAYWRDGALEDLDTAQVLYEKCKHKESLFFAHLALEKALKAVVVAATGDFPPITHNLSVLASIAQVEFAMEIQAFLASMNRFSVAGRYPEPGRPPPPREETSRCLARTREVLEWLLQQLQPS